MRVTLLALLPLIISATVNPTAPRRVFQEPDLPDASPRPLLPGEAHRVSLLTNQNLSDTDFEAAFDPALPYFAQLSHMLARFILRELPFARIKGGYVRDTIINNEQPNDLDLSAPGVDHINDVVMNISVWARQRGLHIVGPFCLRFAGGCRGLHILACNKTHEESGCPATAEMLSVEVSDSSHGSSSSCPLFVANTLTLTGGLAGGLSTLDPARVPVHEAADAARLRELRQLGFGHSLKRVASKFLRRGWIQKEPLYQGEMYYDNERSKPTLELSDCNEWARKLKSKPDNYLLFLSHHPLPKTPRRFRRLQSQTDCAPGTGWDVANHDYTCRNCSSGKYGGNNRESGDWMCSDCVDGQFTSSEGMVNCELCPVGWQRKHDENERTACKVCQAGQVQPREGQDRCKECASGMFASTTILVECTDCAKGKYSEKNAEICQDCVRGRYADEQGLSSCKACPAGRYNAASSAENCTTCPSGRHTGSVSGGDSLDICKNCPPGLYKDENLQHIISPFCIDCPAGWFAQVEKSENCIVCEAGKFAAPPGGKDECAVCPEGRYMPVKISSEGLADQCLLCLSSGVQSSRTTCAGCEAGKVGHTNEIGCHICPPGFFSPGGNTCGSDGSACGLKACNSSSVLHACRSCPSGFYGVDERFHCAACQAGTWSNVQSAPNASTCISCERGKYGELFAQTSEDACKLCSRGKHSAEVGAQHESACALCEMGYYAPDIANRWDPCVKCAPGKYQPNRGSYLPCHDCGMGMYNPTYNASQCSQCLPGQHQPQIGRENCIECDTGKYMEESGAQDSCKECMPGYYSDTKGLSTCLSCNPGKHTSTVGATECKFCPVDEYASEAGSTECLPCPSGRTKTKRSAVECDLCEAGRHWGPGKSTDANRTCIECIPGKYSSKPGTRTCRICPRGSYTGRSRSQYCQCCGIGKYRNNTNATKCEECPAGFAQSAIKSEIGICSRMGSCAPCVAGFYAPSVGAGTCIKCPGGRFNDAPAQDYCQECAAGQYRLADMNGTSCMKCPLGWSQIEDGQVLCLPCAAGAFSDQHGQQKCTSCPGGWYSKMPKSVKCTQKEAGWIVTPGGVNTVAVPLGSHIKAGSAFVTCPAGTFGASPIPSERCSLCPVGFDSVRGSTFCNPCRKGRYGTQNSTHNRCLDCPSGFFQPVSTEPTLACTVCPTGWHQNLTGESSCARIGYTPESCGDMLFLDMSNQENPEEWLCAPCPEGGYCAGPVFWKNATHHNLRPLFGWWEIPPHERKLGTSVEDMFSACIFESSCVGAYNSQLHEWQNQAMVDAGIFPGTRNFTVSCNVALGFEQPSRLCQRCIEGFSRTGLAGCTPCNKHATINELGIMILGITFFAGGFAFLIWLRIWSYRRFNVDRRKNAAHSTIKRILLSHVQMILLVFGLEVRWPRALIQVVQLLSSMIAISPENTHIVECAFQRYIDSHAEFYYTVIMATAIAPLAILGLLALYWFALARACGVLSCGVKLRWTNLPRTTSHVKEQESQPSLTAPATPPAVAGDVRLHRLQPRRQTSTIRYTPSPTDVFVTSCVLMWYLLLPSLIRLGFALFRCRYVGQPSPEKPKFLVLDIEEICWRGQHMYITILVTLPMLVLYGVVVPSVITAVLHRQGEARLTNPSFMLRWGLIHSGYRKERFYWEMVVLLRKYAIIAVVTFEYRDMQQLHMVLGVLILALHFHDSQEPFGREKELAKRLHRFEMFSLLVSLFVIWSGIYFSLDDTSGGNLCSVHSVICGLFIVTILGSNALYVIILSYSCCFEFGKRARSRMWRRPSLSVRERNYNIGDVEMKTTVVDCRNPMIELTK